MDLEDRILEKITIKDLPEEMRYFAEFIGFDNIKTIMKYGGGSKVYIPMPMSFKTIVIERHLKTIKKQLDLREIKEIAREYGVREDMIRKLNRDRDNEARSL